jgi:hypothetical protein
MTSFPFLCSRSSCFWYCASRRAASPHTADRPTSCVHGPHCVCALPRCPPPHRVCLIPPQSVSEYTDKVDILAYSTKEQRILEQINDMCSIVSGLLVAADFRRGQRLVTGKQFFNNGAFFAEVFEIARRHKVCVRVPGRGCAVLPYVALCVCASVRVSSVSVEAGGGGGSGALVHSCPLPLSCLFSRPRRS